MIKLFKFNFKSSRISWIKLSDTESGNFQNWIFSTWVMVFQGIWDGFKRNKIKDNNLICAWISKECVSSCPRQNSQERLLLEVESFNYTFRRSLPYFFFFAGNFAGTAQSADHSSNNGLGKSICSLCAGVGCTIQGGSSVGKFQQEI